MNRTAAIVLACSAILANASVVSVSAAGPTTRTVYVTVVDDNGRAVPGLAPADFVVKESGKEREIASVAPASEKMRLALMIAYPLLGQTYVRQGLATFINRVCPSAEIALFMITQRAEKMVDFASDPNALVDAIRNLPLSQSAASAVVPDAIAEVAKLFENAKPARPVIVLATTEQGLTAEDPEFILSQIAKSKAQFWAVSVGAGGSSALSIADGPQQSGGRRVPIMTLTGFQAGLQQVADDLSSQYLITYTLPDGVKTSDRISVSLKKPGATLRAPNRVPK
jgi:hypothetical protein